MKAAAIRGRGGDAGIRERRVVARRAGGRHKRRRPGAVARGRVGGTKRGRPGAVAGRPAVGTKRGRPGAVARGRVGWNRAEAMPAAGAAMPTVPAVVGAVVEVHKFLQ